MRDHKKSEGKATRGARTNMHAMDGRMRASIEQAPVGIYFTDVNGACTYANKKWLEMAGLSLDQALGDGWKQGLHPDDREKIFATWQAAMQKDQVWDHEYRFLGKDGRVTWVHGLTVKRTDLDGNLAGYIGINIDISKRKEVEDQLEDVNQRLQVLAENINQVIYLYDPASDQFLYVSPAYERIWKEPVEAVYDDPLSFAKKVHPDDLPAFQEAVRKEHEKCIFFDLEYRILPEKGSIKWIHSQNKPVLDENSDHILTVGIAEDITDRKSAEDALRKSEEKFRLIADNSTEIIWQLDLKGKVTYISPSVTKITGYTREDLKGLIYRDIVSSSAVKQALKLFKAALSGEEFPLIVIDVKEKDGSISPIETSVVPMKKDSKVVGIQGIARDVTERVKAEQEREALLARLREAQQLAHLGTWEWDLKADEEHWSDELFAIYGRSPAQDVPHPDDYHTQHHPDDTDKVYDAIEKSMSEGFAEAEYRLFRHDNGEERFLRMRCRTEYGRDKLPTRQIGTVIDITDQKQRERELNQLLRDLNAAQAVSHVGSWRWNIKTNTLEWSDEMYNIFGIDQQAFTGNLQDLIARAIHPEDVPAVEASNRSVIEEGKPIPLEYRVLRPDGSTRTVWAEAGDLVKDKDGKPAYLTGVVMDITKRVREEQEKEKLLESLTEAQHVAHLGSWERDLTTQEENWSEELFRIFGLDPQDGVPPVEKHYEHIHPQDLQRVNDTYKTLLEAGSADIEYRVVHPDSGEIRHVHDRAEVIKDDDGEPIRLQGTVLDITDRKQAEIRLAESRQHYLSLVEDTPVLISRWLEDGTLTFTNVAYASFFGKTPAEMVGSNIFENIPHDNQSLAHINIAKLTSEHPVHNAENKITNQNGDARWVRWTDRAFFDTDGNITHYQSTGIDIHDRHLAEEERARLLHALHEAQRIAHVGSWEWDIQENTAHWSDELFRIYGVEKEQGVPYDEVHTSLIHPEDRRILHDAVNASLKTGEYACEYRIIRESDGAERVVDAVGEVAFDNKGKPLVQRGTARDVTEIRKAEQALQESENLNRGLVDHAGLGIGYYDLDGVVLRMNRVACETIGTSEDQLIGKLASEVFGKEMGSKMMDRIAQAVKHDQPDMYEDQVTLPTGTSWFRSTYTAVADISGTPVGVQIISENITTVKEAEIELAKSQTILENFSDGVLRTDINGNIRFWNNGAEIIYGYSQKEAMGKSVSMLWHEQGQPRLRKIIKLLRDGYDVRDVEATLVRKDGSPIEILLSLLPLKDTRGEVIELVGFSKDISPLKQAQRQLEQSERTLSTLMGNLPGMAYRCENDENWTMRFVSHGCLDLTGYDPQDLINNTALSYNDLIHPDDRQQVRQEIARALDRDQPFALTYRMRCKDGNEKWVWEKGELVSDSLDKHQFLEGFITDISARFAAEEEVRAQANFLDTIIEESPVSMFITDRQGTIIRTNRSLRQKLNLADDQVIGKYNLRRDQNLIEQGVMPQVEAVFTEKTTASFTIYWQAQNTAHAPFKGGRDLWIDVTVFPIQDEKGEIKNIVCKWVDVTEQVTATNALKRSQQRYQSVVEDSPVLISRFMPDDIITFTNSAYSQFFIGKDQGMIGRNIFDFIREEHHQRTRDYLTSFTPQEPIQLYDDLVLRADKQERWVRWTDRALFDEDGTLTGFQAFGEDITDQKKAEIALRESQQHYQSVVEDSPGMIIRYQPDGTITYANANYESFYGDGKLSFIGQNIYDKYSEQETADIQGELAALTPSDTLRIVETQCTRSDGEIRWIRWTDRALFNDDRKLTGFQAFGEDITEKKNTEMKLAESERSLSTLMGNLPGIAYRADAEERFKMRFISQGCRNLTGYTSKEIVENPSFSYEELMHPDDVDDALKSIREAMQSTGNFELAYRITTKRGTEKWVWEKGQVILDNQGYPVHIEGFITDITATKKLQESLRKSEDLLNASQHLSKSGGWEWDIASQTMYWTEQTYRIHDFSPGEIEPGSAKHIERSLQCYDPEGRPLIQAAFQRSLDEGQPYDLEVPFTTANGRKRWVRTTGQPKWMDGKMVSIIGNIIDITDQKAAQQHILDKARFEGLLAQISSAMLAVDISEIDGRIDDALRQVGVLLDLDRVSFSSVIDQETMSLNHTWSRKWIKGTKKLYKLDEYPWMFSTLNDGKIKTWSRSEGIPPELTDAEKQLFISGAIQSFLGIPIQLHDQRIGGLAFTDTKQADRFTPELIESLHLFAQIIGNAIFLRDTRSRVAESEARFRAFMNHFPAGAYIKDQDLKHVYINPVSARFIGIPQEELIGKTIDGLFPPELAQELNELDRSVLEEGIIIEKEGYFQSHSGEHRYQRDIKFPIEGMHGEKLVGGIALDLTAQKEAQEKIREKARFDNLLAQISNDLLQSSPEQIDNGINAALQQVGEFLSIDRIGISLARENRKMIITHRWSKESAVNLRKTYDYKQYPYLFNAIASGTTTNWGAPRDFPENLTRQERDFWRRINIQSLLSIPIKVSEDNYAGITFSDTTTQNKFSTDIEESLNLFAQIIANAIIQRDVRTALSKSEQRYRAVVEGSPVLICRYDPQGEIQFANQAYFSYFDIPPQDIIGKNIIDFSPSEIHDDIKKRLKGLTAKSPAYTVESQVKQADGKLRWVRWTVRALINASNEVENVQSFGIDITAEHQAAERVAESEQQYHSLFTEMASGFLLYEIIRDKNGKPRDIRFIEANPAFSLITGLDRKDIIGKPIRDVLPDFDQDWIDDYIDVAVNDAAFHRKDFNKRLNKHMEFRAFSPREGQCAVILSDISEQEKLFEQVAYERDRAHTYLDIAGVMMLILDENGEVRLINQKGSEILGWPQAEIIGKRWFDNFIPADSRQEIRNVFKRIMGGEIKQHEYVENQILTKNGATRTIAWRNTTLWDENKKVIGTLSSGEDITERLAAQQRMQTLLDISTRLISEIYGQDTLQIAADEVLRKIEEAQTVSVWTYQEENDKLSVRAMSGFKDPKILDLEVNGADGIVGNVAANRQPIILHNVQKSTLFTELGAFAPEMNKIQSVLCAPIIFQERLLGALCVDNLENPAAFNENDLRLIESIANQLAGIVENAILFQEVQRGREELRALSNRLLEVHEEERRAVALDLHDHFGQILTTFKLSLRPEAFIKHSEQEQRARLAEVTAIVDELIEAAEDLSLRLRPAILDDLGINQAFEWHIKRFTRQTPITINTHIDVEKNKRFPGRIEITLYRVLEESLNNALQHGSPQEINVRLEEEEDQLVLQVSDDGKGFYMDAIDNSDYSHTGLTGMQERVRLIGGTINIDSTPQKGTTILVEVPLKILGNA